jgi:hypothetical protein
MLPIQPSTAYVPNVSEGIFQLPQDIYRADTGINMSALKIMRRSVAHWKAAGPKEPTPDMNLGTLMHLAVLQPERYGAGASHHIIPDTYPEFGMKCPSCGSVTQAKTCRECKADRFPVTEQVPWSPRSEYCRNWMEKHQDAIIVSKEDESRVEGMRSTIVNDLVGKNFVENGWREISVFCNDPISGVRRKCLFDLLALTAQDILIGDLKKVQNAEDPSNVFAALSYHLQDAFYSATLADLLRTAWPDHPPIRFIFGCVEGEPPFELLWHELDQESKMLGMEDWRIALDRYAEFLKTGVVEGYRKEPQRMIRPLKLPRWKFYKETF